ASQRAATDGRNLDLPCLAGPRSVAAQQGEHHQVTDLQLTNVLAQLDVLDARLEPHCFDVFNLNAIAHAGPFARRNQRSAVNSSLDGARRGAGSGCEISPRAGRSPEAGKRSSQ